MNRIRNVYDKIQAAWDKYGCLASNFRPELRERHSRIHAVKIVCANALRWEPEMYLNE